MEVTISYPGSIGEMIQGNFNGRDVLSSCPVNLFTTVSLFESNHPIFKYKYQKSMRFMRNILKKWNYSDYEKNMDIIITSEIPMGKGFASSTADLCAAYYALLKFFNRSFDEDELIRECIKIEPTDSIIFDKITIFDYRKGTFKQAIGEYIKFYLLVFEGRKIIDTIEFNSKKLNPLKSIDDLIKIFSSGVKKNSLKEMAAASTESIVRNQTRVEYDILTEVMKLKSLTGGIGIIGAHSGDMLSIIYDDMELVNRALKRASHIQSYNIYKLETINKGEMYDCVCCQRESKRIL